MYKLTTHMLISEIKTVDSRMRRAQNHQPSDPYQHSKNGRTLLAELGASHRTLRPVNLALLDFNPSLVTECPPFRHGRSTASLYGSHAQETTDRPAKTTEKLSA